MAINNLEEEDFCSVDDAALFLGYSRNHVTSKLLGTKIRAIKTRGRIFVDVESLRAFKALRDDEDARRFAPVKTSFDDVKLLSVDQACASLGIGRTSLYRLMSDGKIEAVKIGAKRMVPVAQLEAFVSSLLPVKA